MEAMVEIRSDIRTLTEVIKQGFERMDERFEALQKQKGGLMR